MTKKGQVETERAVNFREVENLLDE